MTASLDVVETAKNYACEVLQVDCTHLSVPHVHYDYMLAFYGYAGAYSETWDADGVFLNPNLLGYLNEYPDISNKWEVYAYSVLLHEVVHYIYWHRVLNEYDPNPADNCDWESVAFAVENVWLVENGWQGYWDWTDHYEGCEK